MRCPKCGYMSFDIIENCVKCGKDISKAAEDLAGSVASVVAPVFLRVPGQEPTYEEPEAIEEEAEVEVEESLDLGVEEEQELDLGGEEEGELDLGEEAVEETELDLGEVEETAEEESADLDLGEEEAAEEEVPEIDLAEEETAEEELDFGAEEEPHEEEESAIGISDLAPEETEEAEAVEEAAAGGGGLEALDVEGLDLDSAPGATDPDKITPGVKTGTALDDFDVDLGDLMSSKD